MIVYMIMYSPLLLSNLQKGSAVDTSSVWSGAPAVDTAGPADKEGSLSLS